MIILIYGTLSKCKHEQDLLRLASGLWWGKARVTEAAVLFFGTVLRPGHKGERSLRQAEEPGGKSSEPKNLARFLLQRQREESERGEGLVQER